MLVLAVSALAVVIIAVIDLGVVQGFNAKTLVLQQVIGDGFIQRMETRAGDDKYPLPKGGYEIQRISEKFTRCIQKVVHKDSDYSAVSVKQCSRKRGLGQTVHIVSGTLDASN